jgi:UPF0042 nucleotide-binding protein
VDNLPVALLPKFLELHEGNDSRSVRRFAFVMDLREKSFLSRYRTVFQDLENRDFDLKIIFLEASEEALLKRYSETRRQHPLSTERGSLLSGIRAEKESLKELRGIAHHVIDTSRYNVHELRDLISGHAEHGVSLQRMQIQVLSFGFKYGVPFDADLVMDVRFLPNPFFIPELKDKDGEDDAVRTFVMERCPTREFLEKYLELLTYLVPLYEKEGKSYLTLAFGCTGGQHRSVAIARNIFTRLKNTRKGVTLTHRDLRR